MARGRRSHGFTGLRVEGGILPPEFLQAIASQQAPHQAGPDYGLSKSLVLKEELARYWRICSDYYTRYAQRRRRLGVRPHKVGVDDWLVPLLRSPLGYEDLSKTGHSVALGDRSYSLTHRAWDKAVPLLLVTRDFGLDQAHPRFGFEGRRQAPHTLMQEYLNAEDNCLWGIVSNGSRLRILRDNPSLTRPSYLEADLDLIFREELYPDFAALWLAIHASRLKPADQRPSSCIMEAWRAKALETGERARENLRDGVTSALRQLGNGFLQHPANHDLRAALHDGSISAESYYQQLLRLIYRLLFLLNVEERNLLHAPGVTDHQRAIYASGFSLARLQERALLRRSYDRHRDLWQGLLITFRALGQGEPALGLPALGGLFSADQCPEFDRAAISNRHLLEAIRVLSFFQTRRGLTRVNYRDMGTEELGSVYESLLELQPVVEVNGQWSFGFVGDGTAIKTKGSQRKLTGSYYTPPTLVGELIKSALEPVLAEAVADHPEDPTAAILRLKVLDPACGSGHFLLAAARRMAAEIARLESDDGTMDETIRQHALREVVQHCIYGVDRNPLSVELCKAALWIETVEPGKPLSFLDAHIQLGDSLIGVLDPEIMTEGIPGEAYKPLTGDDKMVCRSLKKRNRQSAGHKTFSLFDENGVSDLARAAADLEGMPENTLEDVIRKATAWRRANRDMAHRREKLRADLFVGAWFAPKTQSTEAAVPYSEDLERLDLDISPRPGVESLVTDLAERHRFFHWHLRFAEVMQEGGFDVILGNPPWEVSQLTEKEYFAVRAPSIANLTGAKRKAAISQLKVADPVLFRQFQADKYGFDARNTFCRGSGRYALSVFGKLNLYSLFAETYLQLMSPKGRVGVILPTGIATDDSNKKLFSETVNRKRLVSLYDFENREKVFSGIDSRIKFCLLTLTGAHRPQPRAEFAFFLRQTEHLKERERRFLLRKGDFALFNPNTRTCPIFRSRRDMEVAAKLYRRSGVLWKEARSAEPEENPWNISFMQMFNMTSHSGLFRTSGDLEEQGWQLHGNVFVRGEDRYLPLYEAKLFHQYDHRFATFSDVSDQDIGKGKARSMTAQEKQDPQTVIIPRYWVPESEVLDRLKKPNPTQPNPTQPNPTQPNPTQPNPTQRYYQIQSHDRSTRQLGYQLAFRMITNATNERTKVFAVIPETGLGHSASLLLFGSSPLETYPEQLTSALPSSPLSEERL